MCKSDAVWVGGYKMSRFQFDLYYNFKRNTQITIRSVTFESFK